jgi:hypothetical protein
MKRPRTRHAIAAAAALTMFAVPLALFAVPLALLAVPLAGPALAQEDPPPRSSIDLDGVRNRCLAAIDRRVTTLDELDARVTAAARLSDGQEAELHATIDATRSGLGALRTEIERDTDAAALRRDCTRIVEDHRVYLLLAPQVRLLTAADSAQTVVARLEEVISTLQSAIDAAAAGGTDVTEAARLLDAVRANTAEADTLSLGVLDAVSPLTPADYNAGTAAPILRQARTDLATVAKDLAAARADIDTILALLR